MGKFGGHSCRSDIVAKSDDGSLALFKDKVSAARASHLRMIFDCGAGKDQLLRRRLLFMGQALKHCGGDDACRVCTKGHDVYPVHDNGGVMKEQPLFFCATTVEKGIKKFCIVFEMNEGGKMKKV